MSWIGLAPGNILQYLYLRERLKNNVIFRDKHFLEIGSGNGYVSSIFLQMGWKGIGIDLNESACINNQTRNYKYIHSNQYKVICGDFLKNEFTEKFDVIISCMVIEHLPDDVLEKFMSKAISLLNTNGILIIQVPSNMKFWNVEDEIAGHIKRYEIKDVENISTKFNLTIHHFAALNYPISNWLFNLSNYLIQKNEKDKLNLSQQDKTIYTGNRIVPMKTKFPKIFNLILNPITLYPFHIMQKIYSKKYNEALVFYFELKK